MKPSVHFYTLCAVVCAVALAGCSKSKKGSPSGAATNAAPKQAAAPEKPKEMVEFKAKVPAGKRLVQQITITQVREASVPNQPKPITTTLDLVQQAAFAIQAAAAGGGYEMEMEILSQKVETKVGDKASFSFDSSQDRKLDSKSPMAKDFRKLVGGKVKLLANASGKVEKVDGYQAFIRKATLASSAQALGIIRNFYSEEALKQMTLTHLSLPDKKIAVGESWTTQAGQPGGLKVETVYKVKGFEEREGRKCIAVESKGSIMKPVVAGAPGAAAPGGAPADATAPTPPVAGAEGAPPGAPPSPAPAAKPGEIGQITGKYWFDPAAGMIIESELENKSLPSQSMVRTVNKLVEMTDLAK